MAKEFVGKVGYWADIKDWVRGALTSSHTLTPTSSLCRLYFSYLLFKPLRILMFKRCQVLRTLTGFHIKSNDYR